MIGSLLRSPPGLPVALAASLALHGLAMALPVQNALSVIAPLRGGMPGFSVTLPKVTAGDGLPAQEFRSSPPEPIHPFPEATAESRLFADPSLPPETGIPAEPDPIPIDAYRRRSELTAPARPLAEPEFPQPEGSPNGHAVLTILVDDNGAVDAVVLNETTLPQDYLQQLRESILSMRFAPGQIDSKPVKSRFVVEITLSPLPEIIGQTSGMAP
jgi:hypothetical protein